MVKHIRPWQSSDRRPWVSCVIRLDLLRVVWALYVGQITADELVECLHRMPHY